MGCNGKPYEQMDDLGVPLFLETPISFQNPGFPPKKSYDRLVDGIEDAKNPTRWGGGGVMGFLGSMGSQRPILSRCYLEDGPPGLVSVVRITPIYKP